MIVSADGSKFTSRANFAPPDQKCVEERTIVLGKPMQNGFGLLRNELLKLGLDHLAWDHVETDLWCANFGTDRPHPQIARQTLNEFAGTFTRDGGSHCAIPELPCRRTQLHPPSRTRPMTGNSANLERTPGKRHSQGMYERSSWMAGQDLSYLAVSCGRSQRPERCLTGTPDGIAVAVAASCPYRGA
ncbi:integrase core domain-containing protein [Aureimonas frigidaquae]|uniref:Integrase catalytic subunit n=1 Tax=Aureimonas frigidaquae TaxID=424757 RepID=A0A0P0Z2C3_9HYPH|nr:hypothetical protein [Aureimonas frigidaquae]BAT27862.1 integrase catalytic subunit [Aureimonas frigidaquae]